jgi:hypothetical protein
MRIARGELYGDRSAERNPADDRPLETLPTDEIMQVVDQVAQSEAPAEGEAIVLAPELIADDPVVSGQFAGQGA